jgi:hypothetical protein
MTLDDFSNRFDILVSSYRRFKDFDNKEILDSVEFNEYEKSVFLTSAQEEYVIGRYTGANSEGNSFESTEEARRYLERLVSEVPSLVQTTGIKGLSANSKFYKLPDDLMFIVFEQIEVLDNSLPNEDNIIKVQPITHDEYDKLRKNPFRGVSSSRALRIDCGFTESYTLSNPDVVEIISKYDLDSDKYAYHIRYLRQTKPIILEDLTEGLDIEGFTKKTECELNPVMQDEILELAVRNALQTKLGVSKQ